MRQIRWHWKEDSKNFSVIVSGSPNSFWARRYDRLKLTQKLKLWKSLKIFSRLTQWTTKRPVESSTDRLGSLGDCLRQWPAFYGQGLPPRLAKRPVDPCTDRVGSRGGSLGYGSWNLWLGSLMDPHTVRGPHHEPWWVPSRWPIAKNIPASHFRTLFRIPRYGVLQYLPLGIIRPRMILG